MLFVQLAESTWLPYLTELIELLVGGIEGMATGIGKGVSTLVSNFMTTSSGGLSAFGGFVAVFAGISLAIGLGRLILHWATSLGARN